MRCQVPLVPLWCVGFVEVMAESIMQDAPLVESPWNAGGVYPSPLRPKQEVSAPHTAIMWYPASTGSTVPVIPLARSLHRNRAALATSVWVTFLRKGDLSA